MARYWLNIPLHVDAREEEFLSGKQFTFEQKSAYDETVNKLMDKGARLNEIGSIEFVTAGAEELKEFYIFAKAQLERLGKICSLDFMESFFPSANIQPECSNCGYLGRFRDKFCLQCGTELPDGYFDFEEDLSRQ